MNYNIKEVSARLKGTREYLDISAEEMSAKTKTDLAEYLSLESGNKDFSLSFLNNCAAALGVELIELLTGSAPTLKKYSLVKDGMGLPIKCREDLREGFFYQHMAHMFKHKKVEPFMVIAPYSDAQQSEPVELLAHDGQEMDVVLSGTLKFVIGEGDSVHTEILKPGDCIYFDAKNPHGMTAVDGQDCKFLAVLMQ